MSILLIIFGVLMVIGGIGCIAMPITTFAALGWLVGFFVLVVGVSAVVRYAAGHEERSIWDLIGGICGILFGGFLIVNDFAQIVTSFTLAYAAACVLLVHGIGKIIASFKLKKVNAAMPDEMRSGVWLAVLIAGILIVLIGIVCIFQPMISVVSIGWLMGFHVLVSGVETIVYAVRGLQRN